MKGDRALTAQQKHRLDVAANIVLEVTAGLNAKGKECDCCGLMLYEDIEAFRLHTTLTAMAAQMKKRAGTGD